MKKYLKLYSLLAFLMLPFVTFAQYAEHYKLTNFKQIDETSFVFDLELHNTGTIAFGIDAAQCKIVYNQTIYGTQSANIAQVTAVTPVSTDLVGWYGGTGTNVPTLLSDLMTVTGNPGYIVFVTNALANPTYQRVDFLNPGAFIRLATIKVTFSVKGLTPPFFTATAYPFEEVLHGLAFDPNMINHTVNRVTVYDASFPPAVYKVGTIGAFTQMPQPSIENLPATTANRLLAKYCFTGTGNYTDPLRWNNATSAGITGKNVVPPTTSNAIIAGACTVSATNTVKDLTIGTVGQLTLSSGASTSAANLYINSDATSGTGTFVDMNATSASGGLTVSGVTNVQQYVSSGRNWYVSSPLTSAATSIVNATTGNNLWSYAESTGLWTTTDPTFTVGKGYVANVIPINGNLMFSGGALNTGAQSNATLTRAGATKTGFNLVGNPYPSYLSWLSALAASPTLEPTMWYRTQNALATYVFDTFNATPGVGTSNNGTAVTGFVPPMQAFWVRVLTGQTTGTLSLTNAMRTHQDVSTNRLRTKSDVNSTQQLLRLQVSNGKNSDEAIVLFNPNAKDDYDPYDSGKMSNDNDEIPEIYTLVGDEKLVINGLNSMYTNSEIPLGFATGEGNVFTIKATEVSNFNGDTKIILKDKLLSTEQEITPTSGYTFSSEKTDTPERFSIVFKSTGITTGLNNTINNGTQGESMFIYKNQNSQITVNRRDAIGEGTVTVSNAIGQMITSQSTTGTITVVNKTLIPGVYMVKVSLKGKNTTKKVIIN